jgi:hypothetical protein
MYRRALDIKTRLLGPDHPDLVPTLNNLAVLCALDGRLDEAAGRYRRSIALLERTVEPTHPTLETCRRNYRALRDQLRHGA